MADKAKNKKRNEFRVGQVVGLPSGHDVLRAVVLEDRGDVGVGGQRMVRISVNTSATTTTEFETSVDWLVPLAAAVKRRAAPASARTNRRRRPKKELQPA